MRTYASLRAYHDRSDPARLTDLLGIVATSSYRPGDDVHGVESETSAWFFSTSGSVSSDYVDDHLLAVAELLEPRREQLEALRRAGWEFDLMVPWTSYGYDGPGMRSTTMGRLAALGLDVWFPIHHERELERT